MVKVINFDEIRQDVNLSEMAKDIIKDYGAVVILALHKDHLGLKMVVHSNDDISTPEVREMLLKAIHLSYVKDEEYNENNIL